uniref:Uncharacterized protein n=1 Tax=Rhizophora mucronata TaxID=61149 RepID=A0A2P2J2V9_RHIMU
MFVSKLDSHFLYRLSHYVISFPSSRQFMWLVKSFLDFGALVCIVL